MNLSVQVIIFFDLAMFNQTVITGP